MSKINKNILFLLFLLIIKIKSQKNLTLKIYNDLKYNNLTTENFINKYFFNNFYTYLNIGNPIQNIPVLLKFRRYSLLILTNNSNENIFKNFENKNYIPYLSNKFKYDDSKEIIRIEDYESGIKVNDEFSFDKNKKENLNFIMNNISYHTTLSGILGLNINYNSTNLRNFIFLFQLKDKNIIDEYDFTIKFQQSNNFLVNGQIIFGKINNIKYDFSFIINYNYNLKHQKFFIRFDDITYGNDINNEKNIMNDIYTSLNFDDGFILSNTLYKNIIENEFLNELLNKNKCYKHVKIGYYFYICDDDIDISKVKDLNFLLKGNGNTYFTLTYKDLFIKIENKLIFLVSFYISDIKSFTLGYLFFKKFMITIKHKENILILYANKNQIKQPNNIIHLSNIYTNKISKIFLFIYFILISSIILLYIKIYINNRNKKIKYNSKK